MQVKHSEQCLAQRDGQGRSYNQEKNTGNKDVGCPPPHTLRSWATSVNSLALSESQCPHLSARSTTPPGEDACLASRTHRGRDRTWAQLFFRAPVHFQVFGLPVLLAVADPGQPTEVMPGHPWGPRRSPPQPVCRGRACLRAVRVQPTRGAGPAVLRRGVRNPKTPS